MMTANAFFVIAAFATGFAACWFGKDFVLKAVLGAQGFAIKLEMKAAEIKAKANEIKAKF